MGNERIIALAIALLTAVGGFFGGNLSDLSGARAWKESQVEELMRMAELEGEVYALRAQQKLLIRLLDGATIDVAFLEDGYGD